MSDETDESIELTRNKILAGLGAVGAAGAAAGAGTSALFSDKEQLANNELTAGTLNLTVTASVVEASEYFKSNGNGPDLLGNLGTADGAVVTGLQMRDVKPGDWAILCFEISVEGNPGYVEISADNFAQYENGQTEPEAAVDDSAGGSLGLPLDGLGQGELQDELLVEVYNDYDSESDANPPRSYLSGKDDQLSGTAKEVFDRLANGASLGGRSTPTEVGPANSPVKQYFLLELPAAVGNAVQSDVVTFDLVFETEQARNNQVATATRTIADTEISQGEETAVTLTTELDGGSNVDVFERFGTELGVASFNKATLDGETVTPSFVDLDEGGGIVLFNNVGSGSFSVEYSIQAALDAPKGEYLIDPNQIDIDGQPVPIEGTKQIEVVV